jgi:hypothetical protein
MRISKLARGVNEKARARKKRATETDETGDGSGTMNRGE